MEEDDCLSDFFERLINVAQNEGKTETVGALIEYRNDQGIPVSSVVEAPWN